MKVTEVCLEQDECKSGTGWMQCDGVSTENNCTTHKNENKIIIIIKKTPLH